MRKVLVSLVSLITLVSLVSLTSCKKEENGNGTQFRATMEDCTSTKTELDGTALNWVAGDLIKVYGNMGSGIYTATPQTPATVAIFNNVSGETGNAPFRAYYPSTLTTDGVNVTLPATQTYVEGSINEFPMYAESSNSELAFKNLCGVLKLHLTKANTNIRSIAITANNEANGTYSIDYNGGNPELTYEENGTNTTMLVCSIAQAIDEGADFYIYLPPTVDSIKNIVLTAADGSVCTKTVHSSVKVNVNRSQYTLVTFGETDMIFVESLPEGALPGLFSVSATQQVHFSQGNLQYQASTGTWRFAEHQYDCVGSANSNISSTYSGWIDLFGWGTSGWNSGAYCYQPWSTSIAYSDYCPGGSYTNGLTGAYAEADWAWHNAISNGGNAAHQWRTLTQSEWTYLLSSRTNALSKRGTGSINGVGGLIILPDSWTLPSGCPQFNSGFASSYGDWTRNSYTVAQWAQMEAAGAVFLPAAGIRYGTNVYDVGYYGDCGEYWSSTPYPYDRFSAYAMGFSSNNLVATSPENRYGGFSVRPVR